MTLRLAVTPGEPAGVGPELLVKLAQLGSPHELVAWADPELLLSRAARLNLPLELRTLAPTQPPKPLKPGQLAVKPVSMPNTSTPGKLDASNAAYVLDALRQATSACQQGTCDALITGPVHKGIINESGTPFSGHTEFLAELTDTQLVVMMLATEGLRVALATTHLPLSAVPAAITRERLALTLDILHSDLQTKFGIAQPHILVAGLNPHAGENGHLGREEIDIISPVLQQMSATGRHLTGPLPADTLFTPNYLDNCDAVLAMYHDQGLPVLKYKGFGKAVNITLGLPIIRTSVDHGTALDIAGTGKADIGSLQTALDYAAKMAEARCR